MKKLLMLCLYLAMLSGCSSGPYYVNSTPERRPWDIDYNYCQSVAVGQVPMPSINLQGDTYSRTQGSANIYDPYGNAYRGTYNQTTTYTNPYAATNNMFALAQGLGAANAQASVRESCLYNLGWRRVTKDVYNYVMQNGRLPPY